jgi:prevent-host-death family protein
MSFTVSLSDAKNRLGALAERAAHGEIIVIRRRGKTPVVLVSQPQAAETPEELGLRLAAQLGSRHRLTPEKQARLESLAQKNQAGALDIPLKAARIRLPPACKDAQARLPRPQHLPPEPTVLH